MAAFVFLGVDGLEATATQVPGKCLIAISKVGVKFPYLCYASIQNCGKIVVKCLFGKRGGGSIMLIGFLCIMPPQTQGWPMSYGPGEKLLARTAAPKLRAECLSIGQVFVTEEGCMAAFVFFGVDGLEATATEVPAKCLIAI